MDHDVGNTNHQHEQMCKKIVQLTRVIHRLNALNQEHNREQLERDNLRQEELTLVVNDAEDKIRHLTHELDEKDGIIRDLTMRLETNRQQLASERKNFALNLEQYKEQSHREFSVEMERITGDYELIKQKSKEFEEHIKGLCLKHNEEVSSLKSKCQRLKYMLSSQSTKHQEEDQELITRHRDEVAKLTADRASYESKLNIQVELTEQIKLKHKVAAGAIENQFKAKMIQSGKDLQSKIERLQTESELQLSNLDSKLKSQIAEADQYRSLVEETNQEMNKLRMCSAQALEREREKVCELHGLLGQRDEAIMNATNDLSKSNRKLEDITNEKAKLEDELCSSREKIASLTLVLQKNEEVQNSLQIKLCAASDERVEMMNRHQKELKERDVSIKQANDNFQGMYIYLGDLRGAVVGLKKSIADLKDDLDHRMKSEWHDLQSSTKDAIIHLLTKFRANNDNQIHEIQLRASQDMIQVNRQHDDKVNSIIEETKIKQLEKESEYRDIYARQQYMIREMQNKIISMAGEAKCRNQEIALYQSRVQLRLLDTCCLERLEVVKRGLTLAINSNRKWTTYAQCLQALHLRQIHCFNGEIQSKLLAHETRCRETSGKMEAAARSCLNYEKAMKGFIKDLNISYQLAFEKHTISLQKKMAKELHEQQRSLRAQVVASIEETSTLQNQLDEAKAEIYLLNSNAANGENEIVLLKERCDILRSEKGDALRETKLMSEKCAVLINDIKNTHEQKLQTIEADLRSEHKTLESSWNKTKTILEDSLSKCETNISDLYGTEKKLQCTIQQLHHEVESVKATGARDKRRLKNEVDKLLSIVQKQEQDSIQMERDMRMRYENQIRKLEDKLDYSHINLQKSQEIIQSVESKVADRDPADVEKIQLLEKELVKLRDQARQLETDMHYYKCELKNREENFNSRFKGKNDRIDVLSTFKPRNTMKKGKRFGKENSMSRIRRVTTFKKEGL